MPECRVCKFDKPRRRVIKRKPLIDITDEMPFDPHVKEEWLCVNTIKKLRPTGKDFNGRNIYKWFDDTCDNHIVIQILNI